MNMFVPTPMLGISGTTGQNAGTTATVSTNDAGFGAIIEGLLATNGGTSGQSMLSGFTGLDGQSMLSGFASEEILAMLMKLLSGEVSGVDLTQMPSGEMDVTEEELAQNLELQAMIMAMSGMFADTTQQTQYTDTQQMLLPNYSTETNAALADIIGRLPAEKQQQMIQLVSGFTQTTQQSDESLVTPTVAAQSEESDIARLLTLLKGTVITGTEKEQTTSTQSFSDTLARMQLTGTVSVNEKTNVETNESVDLNTLQQNIVAAANTPQATVSAQTSESFEVLQTRSIAQQLLQPLQQQAVQKNEFTVQLSPEGLGDITVKMVDTAGKLSLVLTASSNETARLLNAEMATLQAALRPYQPESEPTIVVYNLQGENANDYLSDGFAQQNRSNREQGDVQDYGDAEISIEQTAQEIIAQLQNSLLSERV